MRHSTDTSEVDAAGDAAFNPDDLIQPLRSYYDLLIRYYLPTSSLRLPPPDGWPEITPFTHAFMKKSDVVLSLMKQLPFVVQGGIITHGYQIYPMTGSIDYVSPDFLQGSARFEDLLGIEPGDWDHPFPSHVLAIAGEYESDTGEFWMIDTRRGVVVVIDGHVVWYQNDPESEYEGWEETYAESTWLVGEFFDMKRKEVLEMKVVPETVSALIYDVNPLAGKRKEILQHCGWPGDGYDKDKFLEIVKRMAEEEKEERLKKAAQAAEEV